jgi:hypothetical protein
LIVECDDSNTIDKTITNRVVQSGLVDIDQDLRQACMGILFYVIASFIERVV